MEKTYVIGWTCKDEPRFGQGKKLFSREEAEQLAAELNADYPAFFHEPINLQAAAEPQPAEVAASTAIIDFTTIVEAAEPAVEAPLAEPVAI
jgi:hypothetical protein